MTKPPKDNLRLCVGYMMVLHWQTAPQVITFPFPVSLVQHSPCTSSLVAVSHHIPVLVIGFQSVYP